MQYDTPWNNKMWISVSVRQCRSARHLSFNLKPPFSETCYSVNVSPGKKNVDRLLSGAWALGERIVRYFLVEEIYNVGKSCMYSSVGYMQNVVVMEHAYCSWFCITIYEYYNMMSWLDNQSKGRRLDRGLLGKL